MSSKIYRVIKIISDKQIVINAGKNDSVTSDDEFEIFQTGVKVFDPDTNEFLGTLDYVKAVVTATTVLDKMSICKHFTEKEYHLGLLSAGVTHKTIASSMNVDPQDISGGFEDINRKIRVGDLVRKI